MIDFEKKLNKLENVISFKDIFDAYGKDFKVLCQHPLPENFIDYYFWKLKPFGLERTQTLSPYLLTKYDASLNWYLMSRTQELSEAQIEAHAAYVNWNWISLCQNLSYEFLVKWKSKIRIEALELNKKIDPNIIILFKKLKRKLI